MKISIIIPVYNSKEYIEETVGSLLRQKFDDYEILLIDDGSTDGSGEICRQLEKDYPQVHFYTKPNGGVCSARNYGLDRATGTYIVFADNDDECLPGLLDENYALIVRYNADLVRFVRIHRVIRDGVTVSEERTSVVDGFVPSAAFHDRLDDVMAAGHGVWSGMYRKEFLEKNHIRFDEKMHFGYEDVDFMAQVFQYEPATVMNSKAYYIWKMRYDHSTSAKVDKNGIDSLLSAVKKEILVYKRAGFPDKSPGDYLIRLTEYLYTALRYVSPVKAKMNWNDRISYLRCFAEDPVFHENCSKNAVQDMKGKSKKSYIIYTLFNKKQYGLLLFLITVSHRIEEIKGH